MWHPEFQLEGNKDFSLLGYALVQPAVGFHCHKDAALPCITFWATRPFFFFCMELIPCEAGRRELLAHAFLLFPF